MKVYAGFTWILNKYNKDMDEYLKDICLVWLFKKQIMILACPNQCWELKVSWLEEPLIKTDNVIGFELVWLDP